MGDHNFITSRQQRNLPKIEFTLNYWQKKTLYNIWKQQRVRKVHSFPHQFNGEGETPSGILSGCVPILKPPPRSSPARDAPGPSVRVIGGTLPQKGSPRSHPSLSKMASRELQNQRIKQFQQENMRALKWPSFSSVSLAEWCLGICSQWIAISHT